jgi:hypothetical protein
VITEKRPCPSCGNEISVRAKQCKHCFEFVTPFPETAAPPPSPPAKRESTERIAIPAVTTSSPRETSKYRYRVVPFIGRIQTGFFSSDNARTVSEQLQNVIDEQASYGWDFYSLEKVNIEVQPGCIGGLLGQSASYITSDQVIFRQAISLR